LEDVSSSSEKFKTEPWELIACSGPVKRAISDKSSGVDHEGPGEAVDVSQIVLLWSAVRRLAENPDQHGEEVDESVVAVL
jgi:hypothetical protein